MVTLTLPMVGFLLAYLAVPSGVASIVLMLAALMLAIWSLEERDGEPGRRGAGRGGHGRGRWLPGLERSRRLRPS